MRDDGKIEEIEQELREERRKIERLECEIRELEHPITGDFHFKRGKHTMADGTILKGQTQIDAIATESNAAGPVAIVPANMSWTVDDPTIVSPAINPDGSATFTKVGDTAADRVATVTWNDTFYKLTATHKLTVQGDGTLNPPTAGDFNFANAK